MSEVKYMKMTTKGRYGLRAMIDLSRHYEKNTYISLKSISERQNISENYLERLLAKLRKAELVITHRGTQGGYMLNKLPKEINVRDILLAVEEPLFIVECTKEKENFCLAKENCTSNYVWAKMAEGIKQISEEIYLDELINN